jgi:NitT/TauT family transport system substrate-binding protein
VSLSRSPVSDRSISRRRLLAGFGGAAVGGVLLSACGNDEESGRSADGKTTTIRLAGIPSAPLSAFKRAMADKAFEKRGLNIQYKEYAESAAVYTAYRTGEVDGGLGGIPALANLVVSGVDRKVAFVLQRTTNAIMVRSNSNINTIKDLKGKRLGLFGSAIGSSTNQFFALCRKFHGFNPTVDCQVRYGAPDLMANLLGQNEIDMALTIDPAGIAKVVSGEYKIVGDIGPLIEEATGLKAMTAGWDFDTKFLGENQEAVTAFKEVNLEYQKKFNNDQTLWDAALKELYKVTDQKQLDIIWNNQKGRLVETWSDDDKKQAQDLLTFLSQNGEPNFLPKVPDGLFA